MTRIEYLKAELAHEAKATRRHLERLPTAQFGWQPHPKSFTAGRLASHIVDCLRWAAPIFAANELDMDAAPYTPFNAATAEAMLEAFDAEVARATDAMSNTTDTSAAEPWRMKMRGKVWFEKSREAAYRDMTLSHLIHHRGQFSVYLRLLEVPVPGSYGPTADDRR